MRTLTLSRERTLTQNVDDIVSHFYNDTRPMCNTMTGLFAYEDRPPYLVDATVGRRVWNPNTEHYEGPDISSKLRVAIQRWIEKGKGYAIIHGRSIPDLSRVRLERIPYKIDADTYFYDLGSFGQAEIWNTVCNARRHHMRLATNHKLYDAWVNAVIEGDDVGEWNYMRRMNAHDEYPEHIRSWTTFVWKDGKIMNYNTRDNDADTESSYKHYKAVDHAGINRMEFVNTSGREI